MKTHTLEEVNELKDWFDAQQLPQSFYIDKATFIPNVKETVDSLFMQAYLYYENPKMQGCIVLLKKIKKQIEETSNS